VLRTRLIILAFVLAIAGGVGLFFGVLMPRLPLEQGQPAVIQNTATLLQEIQGLSELVTVKYVLEKVVILEDVKWYGENRVLLLAHGVVKAGVDLRAVQPEHLVLESNKVHVALPHAAITDVYLDEHQTRIIEHSTGLLRAFDRHLQVEARRQAIDELRRTARQAGITEDAQDRARKQLSAFLGQLGFEVRFEETTRP
jgi:hypothetical protein